MLPQILGSQNEGGVSAITVSLADTVNNKFYLGGFSSDTDIVQAADTPVVAALTLDTAEYIWRK